MSRKDQRKSADKAPAATQEVPPVAISAPEVPPVVAAKPEVIGLPVASKNARGSVDDMSGATLQAYARKVGIMERDIQGLSEDRLRQNIRAMIYSAMEDA